MCYIIQLHYIVKKILLGLVAVALMAVSCQNESWNFFGFDGSVGVVLKVKSPKLASTRAGEGLDSSVGAIDNFDNNPEFWSEYDLRYILEIYEVKEKDGVVTTSAEPIYKRQVATTPSYTNGINFDIRLVPNRTYKFVVWADFVDDGKRSDLYYNTADLRAIHRNESVAHKAMDEAMDAYHISLTKTIKKGGDVDLRLTRPFAKLRVVAIDYHEISSYSTLDRVEVNFDTEKNPVFKSFNAVNSEISDSCTKHNYVCDVDPAPYKLYSGKSTEGEDINGFVLFSDYILAPRDGENPVSFSIDIYDAKGKVRTVDFDTQIPTCRNHLTTVIGNMLTENYIADIRIDDTLLTGDDYLVDADEE